MIERVKLYGISEYFDEEATMSKLKKRWGVHESEDTSFDHKMAMANGYMASFASNLCKKASDYMFKFGIVGAA